MEFDADKNGYLDRHELRMFLIQFFKQYKLRIPLSEEFIDATFSDIDKNGDGKIQLDELIAFFDEFLGLLIQLFNDAIETKPDTLIKLDQFKDDELD